MDAVNPGQPPPSDFDEALNELSHEVIGAAIAVHRELGPGYDESLYENALCVELKHRQIQHQRQVLVNVYYRDEQVGTGRMDLLIDNRLIVELKVVETLAAIHTAQLVSYLKATRFQLGLLINFNVSRLRDGIKRVRYP